MIDVSASPTKSQRNERCARKPATAGPAATPAFTASRYIANPVMRRPTRREVRDERIRRRTIELGGEASERREQDDRVGCRSPVRGRASSIADENIETTMLLRRPMRVGKLAARERRRHAAKSIRAQRQTGGGSRVPATRQVEDEKREYEAAEPIDEGPAEQHPRGTRKSAEILPER